MPSSTRPNPLPSPPLLSGRIVNRLPTSRKVVTLTFDAGANDAGVPKILATLDATGATGTFFITGRWAALYPHWVRRIAARYPIGNHTFDHLDLLGLSPGAVSREIRSADAELTNVFGQPIERLFRFPYGSSNSTTLRIANELGYTAIGWTADTLGWEGTSGGQTEQTILAHAVDHLQPGEIILMHVGSNPTDRTTLDADTLPAIITAIRSRGYTLVSVSQPSARRFRTGPARWLPRGSAPGPHTIQTTCLARQASWGRRGSSQSRERFVDLGPAFVADEQSFELVEPGEGAFDDPAVAAQPGDVLGVARGVL